MNSPDDCLKDKGNDEPITISVGLITDGAPILSPYGDFSIRREGDAVVYTPLNGESYLCLENLLIGKDFHWQQTAGAKLPGSVRVQKDTSGKWHAINTLPLETYLACVIGSEMNADAPAEFLKAHSVISRSWALGKIRHAHHAGCDGGLKSDDTVISWEDTAAHVGFDVCSDDHCQRYQGICASPGKANEIISSTEGLVLTDTSGNLADTRYSKCCGGITERFSACWQDIDFDYLTSKKDPWCDLSQMTDADRRTLLRTSLRNYDLSAAADNSWELRVNTAFVRQRLNALFGSDPGEVLDMEVEQRGDSGRVKLLRIDCTEGIRRVGKELTIRRLLSPDCLRSSLFYIYRPPDGGFLLKGKGWGHGVGLCQIGAARMAFDGASFADILSFYFSGTRPTHINQLK